MKTYTWQEVLQMIASGQCEDETDNEGQIVIYTGVFRHNDGSIKDLPDLDYED